MPEANTCHGSYLSTNDSPALTSKALVYMLWFNFFPWFKFYFPLFWGMVMYDNKFKTKENKI